MSNDKSLIVTPRTVEEVRILAAAFARSSLLPDAFRGKEPDVFLAIWSGLELGLAPMAALRGINVIKGRPSLSAATMQALVLGRGVAEYFECVEDKGHSVTYETKRRDGRTPQRATWTLEDAKRAGLGGDNWAKYPNDMLHARCMARLARRVYPDVLAGYYTDDEIEHMRPPTPSRPPDRDVVDAEVVSETRADEPPRTTEVNGVTVDSMPPEMKAIDLATTDVELASLAPKLAKLPDAWRKKARTKYADKLVELRKAAEVAATERQAIRIVHDEDAPPPTQEHAS